MKIAGCDDPEAALMEARERNAAVNRAFPEPLKKTSTTK
jgi:hypothetical protein